jgi:hypothetical protein
MKAGTGKWTFVLVAKAIVAAIYGQPHQLLGRKLQLRHAELP